MSRFEESRNEKRDETGEPADLDVMNLTRGQRKELWVYRILKWKAAALMDS